MAETLRSLPLTDLSEDEKVFRESCATSPTRGSVPWSTRWTTKRRSRGPSSTPASSSGSWASRSPRSTAAPGPPSSCRSSSSRSSRASTPPWACWWTSRTRWSTTPSCAGAARTRSRSTSRSCASKWVGAYALSEAGSGSDAFALACRAEDKGDHYLLTGRKLWITNAAEAELFIVFANVDPGRATRGSRPSWSSATFPGFTVGKKEDKLGIRASSTCELHPRGLPRAEGERARRGRQGLQDRHRDAQRGPHRHRRADGRRGPGRLRARACVHRGAQAVRPGRSPTSRACSSSSPSWRRARGGAAAGLQRGAPARRRGARSSTRRPWRSCSPRAPPSAWPRSAIEIFGGVRLHQGVPGGEVLPRPEGGPDLRGHDRTCSSWSSPSRSSERCERSRPRETGASCLQRLDGPRDRESRGPAGNGLRAERDSLARSERGV